MIDCSAFSSPSYTGMSSSTRWQRHYKTRGAYTFLSDFILVYAPNDVNHVMYTLGRDGSIEKFADDALLENLGDEKISALISHDPSNKAATISDLVDLMKEPSQVSAA